MADKKVAKVETHLVAIESRGRIGVKAEIFLPEKDKILSLRAVAP